MWIASGHGTYSNLDKSTSFRKKKYQMSKSSKQIEIELHVEEVPSCELVHRIYILVCRVINSDPTKKQFSATAPSHDSHLVGSLDYNYSTGMRLFPLAGRPTVNAGADLPDRHRSPDNRGTYMYSRGICI